MHELRDLSGLSVTEKDALILALLSAVLASPTATAQEKYPNHPITIVVGYGSPMIFVQKPIAAVFLACTALTSLWPLLGRIWETRRRDPAA